MRGWVWNFWAKEFEPRSVSPDCSSLSIPWYRSLARSARMLATLPRPPSEQAEQKIDACDAKGYVEHRRAQQSIHQEHSSKPKHTSIRSISEHDVEWADARRRPSLGDLLPEDCARTVYLALRNVGRVQQSVGRNAR